MVRQFLVAMAVFSGLMVVPGRSIRAADNDIDAEQVRQSIDRGIAYLKSQQNPVNGTWPDHGGQVGGVTALCTLALINCGVPIEDEVIQRSLTYLRTVKPATTYVTSLQTMVFCLAEPQKDLLAIQRNAKWLEETQIKDGLRRGSWAYPGLAIGGDNSNSQFALLGLYEAERAGVPVQDRTWQMTLDYWKSAQNSSDNSFGYYKAPNGEAPGTGSMTCAGISSLVIASGRMAAGDAEADGDRVQCCGNQAGDDSSERIDRALRWLGRVFSVQQNPQHGGLRGGGIWHYYFLYGVERVGRMTARRFIGDHDWYREGAAFLCSPNVQQVKGFWQGEAGIEADPNIATSFALLFLGKGRRPILMSKVQHGPGNDWDHHRNDVANLTNYVESHPHWKKDFPLGMSWQVVDITKASVEDLQQAPVLFINGSEVPEIDERQGQNLREYVDRGGFIFAEACCANSKGFDNGFRALMTKIFPPEYKLKVLPPEHPVWRAEEKVPPEQQRTLLGIDYGCRTSVIYCPPPGPNDPPNGLSCFWELSSWRARKFRPAVAAQIDAANKIGINVLAYATNRELKSKEQNFDLSKSKDAQDEFARGKLYIAKLRHLGGCDTAPAALPHLLEAANRELQMRVSTEQRLIDLTDPSLFKYHMVFMHGRRSFSFTPAEREKLRTFLKRGGTLLADSICANPEFTASFRREMQAIFAGDPDVGSAALAGSLANRSPTQVSPTQPLIPIPAKDPIFSTEYGGYNLATVSIRVPQGGDGQLAGTIRKLEPEMEGIRLGDRWAVVFSKFDLSCALEKHDSLECQGYTRDDAERIGLNVLLYTLHQ
jgi:Domain of unknown function (DUF4159)